MKGQIYVITAPSGAGKTTLVRAVASNNENLMESVSHTTRAIREGEVDGVDYHFVTKEKFDEIKTNDGFVESFTVFGNSYGTSKKALIDITSKGSNALLILDYKGAYEMRRQFGEGATLVFIMPPSIKALESRLRARATDEESVVKERLLEAEAEIEQASNFDHIIVNDDLQQAISELQNIIT